MNMDPKYLLGASDDSLGSALLNRLARASATRKQLVQLLDRWSDERAEAIVIEWARKCRDGVTSELPARPDELLDTRKPGPITSGAFRDSLRKLLESA